MLKNNKLMIKGKCVSCNKQNAQYISIADAKKGGFIFTVAALLAGLGAVGSLAGWAAGIATAVQKSKAASKLLKETKRH